MPIIKQLTDTDLYKLTMWQALMHSHPGAQTRYEFVCRNKPLFPLAELKDQVNEELDHLCTLKFTQDELNYIGDRRYIKADFVDFLSIFHYQRKFIKVDTNGDDLSIITEGPQIHTMGYEIPVLGIVSELYGIELQKRGLIQNDPIEIGRKNLKAKIELLRSFIDDNELSWKMKTLGCAPFELIDFGGRRRFSSAWHDEVVATLLQEVPEVFKGTSNVHLAQKYDIVPIGTMAHEYMQSYQGFEYRLRDFQKMALEGWVHEYRGDLGTALTDTVGFDAFLEDFDLYFAKLFDGLRHDSGDPFEWANKAINHYQKLKINPSTKRLTFSDGLDIPKCIELWNAFSKDVQLGFGVGTNLTNDVGIKPLNIVMKLMTCNGQPVAKLSDSPGKTLCRDETFLAYLSRVFNVKRL